MIKLGYHPATWIRDGNPHNFYRALDEMALVGWDGFEYSGPWLEQYYSRPEELRKLLKIHSLELTTYYCRLSFIDPRKREEEMEIARQRIDFLAKMGCSIFLLDGGDKRKGGNREEDYRMVAEMANHFGEISKAKGITTIWHQHWGTMFEDRASFYRLMELTDPDLVAFCPDTAQLAKGDFNLQEVFTRYIHRIKYVHFKDLDREGRFIELGRGIIDFPSLLKILKDAGYDGWIVVDLDYTILSAKESSAINLRYLKETLGIPGRKGSQGGKL